MVVSIVFGRHLKGGCRGKEVVITRWSCWSRVMHIHKPPFTGANVKLLFLRFNFVCPIDRLQQSHRVGTASCCLHWVGQNDHGGEKLVHGASFLSFLRSWGGCACLVVTSDSWNSSSYFLLFKCIFMIHSTIIWNTSVLIREMCFPLSSPVASGRPGPQLVHLVARTAALPEDIVAPRMCWDVG